MDFKQEITFLLFLYNKSNNIARNNCKGNF